MCTVEPFMKVRVVQWSSSDPLTLTGTMKSRHYGMNE